MKANALILSLVVMLIIPWNGSAQYKKMLDVLEDTQTEVNDGKFTLRFFDAKTGQPVGDASVSIANVGDYSTDMVGKVTFDKLKDGKYAFRFSKQGYISAVYEFEVIAESVFYNRFSVCPRSELGALRIVLDWDKSPADLDLHLVKEGGYHISYRNRAEAVDGSARLDRDDQDGYGPETITLSRTDNNASYTCYVHDYTNQSANHINKLSRSKAVVRVYNNNELTDTFYIPKEMKGNKWTVFRIQQGEVKGVNTVADGE